MTRALHCCYFLRQWSESNLALQRLAYIYCSEVTKCNPNRGYFQILDTYRGELMICQPRSSLVEDETGDVLADSVSIRNR
jgi:hypothetical protein